MRVCLVSPEETPWGGIGHFRRRQASLLASRHEVTLIHGGGVAPGAAAGDPRVREIVAEPGPALSEVSFACEAHRRSAAVLEAIEGAYASAPPDCIDFCDYQGHGLVTLQARKAGHPLLRETSIWVQICATAELVWLYDGVLGQQDTNLVCDMERTQLRMADRILYWGEAALTLYRNYYEFDLPPAVRIPPPFERPAEPPPATRRNPDGPLRILYVGRLQRFKGSLDLVDACLRLPFDDWELTMIGADTSTAPGGCSVRMAIEATCGEDPRVRIEEAASHEELQRRWSQYDLFVLPSRFEVWGNVMVEAMRAGLPVLATPAEGPVDIVEPGVSGWLADDVGAPALTKALSELGERREELEDVRASGEVFRRFLQLTDPEQIVADYGRLLSDAIGDAGRAAPAPSGEKLVTGIVPYYQASPFVEEAVKSLLSQTHRNLDVLIVNDGSFEPDDSVLDRLAEDPRVTVVTQLNRGESEARNLAAELARGEYLVMLDADNVLEAQFVERALAMCERDPELAYVTCWLRMIDTDGAPQSPGAGYAPLGNGVVRDDAENWDGDALALFPRRVFTEFDHGYDPEVTIQSDWDLYRTLRDDGRFGAVIPELLMRYRVRPQSLLRAHAEEFHRVSWDESRTRRRLRRTLGLR